MWEKERALSPYHYCANNPERLTDPGGMQAAPMDAAVPYDEPSGDNASIGGVANTAGETMPQRMGAEMMRPNTVTVRNRIGQQQTTAHANLDMGGEGGSRAIAGKNGNDRNAFGIDTYLDFAAKILDLVGSGHAAAANQPKR